MTESEEIKSDIKYLKDWNYLSHGVMLMEDAMINFLNKRREEGSIYENREVVALLSGIHCNLLLLSSLINDSVLYSEEAGEVDICMQIRSLDKILELYGFPPLKIENRKD